MKRLAVLNYVFMFDPADTGWSGKNKFNQWIIDFCKANGLQANVVETAGNMSAEVIFFRGADSLSQVKDMKNPQVDFKKPDERRKQPGSALRDMGSMPLNNARERDFKKGKLLKSKGYIKR